MRGGIANSGKLRGIRGEWVLYSTSETRGVMDAVSVGWHGQGGVEWYYWRGGEIGLRGEVEKETALLFTCPLLARASRSLRWHGVAYGRSYLRGAWRRRETSRHSLLGCTYPHR